MFATTDYDPDVLQTLTPIKVITEKDDRTQ